MLINSCWRRQKSSSLILKLRNISFLSILHLSQSIVICKRNQIIISSLSWRWHHWVSIINLLAAILKSWLKIDSILKTWLELCWNICRSLVIFILFEQKVVSHHCVIIRVYLEISSHGIHPVRWHFTISYLWKLQDLSLRVR